jgi:homogentisate phytyltransferase / homogentisate geranylgeranyltransferase
MIASLLSTFGLFAFAIPMQYWESKLFLTSFLQDVFPTFLMNIFVVGLNQIFSVEIDRINKPYLPIPSGKLSKK